MKRKTNNKKIPYLRKGLAGILLAVSIFVLPVMLYAEGAAYVMPQEQVFLDESQVEAAKKQLEADAASNARPQKAAPVVKEKVIAAPAAEQKQETQPAKYVMPEEQVYLDPSQVEAAKKQKAADAIANSQPQAKNVEIVTGDRVIAADVKVVEQDNKGNAPTTNTISETKKAEDNNNVTVQPEKVETEKPAPVATKEIKEVKPQAIKQQEAVKEKTETPKAVETKNLESKPEIKHKPFQLHRFGMAKEFTTHHGTVGEVLQEMKVNLDGRTVYPPPETQITDGMVIHVLARKSFLSEEEVEVPFGTQVINDAEMAFGAKKVEKEGVKGKDIVIYENITRPGREQKIELDRHRVVEPVNEIVRQGVAQSILTPEGYVRYKKKIYGEATAYTWGGGAIVGTRIDLFMDSLHECFQWGRRDVEIYILE